MWDVLVLTRLEERGRLSAPGSLIKGLQGREQATRVKITHTLHRAAGIREPEERGEEIDGEDEEEEEEEEEEGEGWSRELGGGEWRATGRAERAGCSQKLFFSPFLHLFMRLHESMSFTERERWNITVIALRQRITLSHHSQSCRFGEGVCVCVWGGGTP